MSQHFRSLFKNVLHSSTCDACPLFEDNLACCIDSGNPQKCVSLFMILTLLIDGCSKTTDMDLLNLTSWTETLPQISDCRQKNSDDIR